MVAVTQEARQAIRKQRAKDQAGDYRVSRAVVEGPGAGVSFWVANTRTQKLYVVHEGRCTCPDYTNRCQDAEGKPNGLKCKHVILCEEYLGIHENPFAEATATAPNPELDAVAERIARARRDREALWGPESEWD